MRLSVALALLAIAGLAACERAPDATPNEANAANAVNPAVQNSASNAGNVSIAPDPVLDRLGPIRVGATIADLTGDGLAVAGRDEPVPGSTCSYARFRGLDDVAVMLDGERVVRIDVKGQQHEGPHGLRVGQSEADAIARLDDPHVQPHPYTGPEGHYLVMHDDGAPFGLIAETDGNTVQSWRIGQWEQVQWIETCF